MIQRTISALKKLEKTGLLKTSIDLEPPFGGNRRLVEKKDRKRGPYKKTAQISD